MKPVILFRNSLGCEGELEVASKYFTVVENPIDVPRCVYPVIGRYSVLPFYEEVSYALNKLCSELINTHRQHLFVADMMAWVPAIQSITPKTWDGPSSVEGKGPFVLKGQTNSKKHLWNTHMFARDRVEMMEVVCRLMDDSLISSQKIYIREYVPLKQYAVGIGGLPVTEEYRFFLYKKQILCGAFYWSDYADELDPVPEPDEEVKRFVSVAINMLYKNVDSTSLIPPFVVMDVARKADGNLMVVELNDGQMSGLSENNPDELYCNLRKEYDFDFAT